MPLTRATLRLIADLDQTVNGLIDTATRDLTRAWAGAWDILGPHFAAAVTGILSQGEDLQPGRRAIERDPALQDALAVGVRALTDLAALAAIQATGAARAAAEAAADGQAAIIASQLPPQTPVTEADFGGFARRALEAMIARIAERITALTRPLSQDADREMRRELVRGIRAGTNPRDTARRILQALQGAFNGGLTRALTIARTETMDAYRAAAAAGQYAARDVLDGWVWLAQLTPRTCGACWIMHGTTHPLTEPGPQGHPQCRCSRAPAVMSWADLGYAIDEPPSLVPDARTAFDGLSRAEQLQIMGPGRLAALRRGDAAWQDLAVRRDNPGWRPSVVPTPVHDLTRAG